MDRIKNFYLSRSGCSSICCCTLFERLVFFCKDRINKLEKSCQLSDLAVCYTFVLFATAFFSGNLSFSLSIFQPLKNILRRHHSQTYFFSQASHSTLIDTGLEACSGHSGQCMTGITVFCIRFLKRILICIFFIGRDTGPSTCMEYSFVQSRKSRR